MIILEKGSDWNEPNWINAYFADKPQDKAKVIGVIRPTKDGIEIEILGSDGNPKGLEERISIDRSKSPPQIRVNLLS